MARCAAPAKLGLAVCAVLLCGGCSREAGTAVTDPVNGRLMEAIERQVRMPPGARPLNDYARFYARAPVDLNVAKGTVMGVYRIPATLSPPPPGAICEAFTEHGGLRKVPCDPGVHRLLAGQRKWLEDYMALPFVDDGGCNTVNVEFDSEKQIVQRVYCNGPLP
jgi:hypothetical protein